jgi:NitT/TauT family transport system substrate-binding protein
MMDMKRNFNRRAFLAASAFSLMAPNLAFGAKDKVAVQLGWIKNVQHGGFFVGIEKSFFEEEGIEAEVLTGGPSVDSVNVVASGRALLGDRDSTSVILARAKGIPIKAFAASFQISPYSLLTLKGHKISTLKEMEGKTIAIPQGRRATMAALLKRANIDPAKITFVPAGPDPGPLVTKQVDGFFGWYTNQGSMLALQGIDIDYTTAQDLGDPTYPATVFALDETIDKKKDLLTRYTRALVKACQWYHDNPEAVAKLTVEKYAAKGLDLAQQTIEAKLTAPLLKMGEAGKYGLLWIDTPFFARGLELSKDAGMTQGDLPLNAVVTQDIVKAVHGRT